MMGPRRPTGSSRRAVRVLDAGGAIALACLSLMPQWAVAADTLGDFATPITCARPVMVAPDPGASASDATPGAGQALSRGTWMRMATSPFGSEYEPVAWTGTRMIVVDGDTGRTATYRPERDRWREVSRAPRRTDPTRPSVWTGSELIISEIAEDGSRLAGLAYDADRDRWRELAVLELDPDSDPDHVLIDAVWTGSHVVVVDGLGLLAAYDPLDDCWLELGDVPGEPWAWHLYAMDGALLVESRRWDAPVEIRAFDPVTGTWSEPSIGPLDREAAEDGGHAIDGRLVYITWRGDVELEGAANARFDPATMTWSTFDHSCDGDASGTTGIGDLLVAADGRRALDGRTLECFELPAPPRDLNGTERRLWTGEALIVWSGIRSLPEPPRRSGLILEPAEAP